MNITPRLFSEWTLAVFGACFAVFLVALCITVIVCLIRWRKEETAALESLKREYELSGENFYSFDTWKSMSGDWRISRAHQHKEWGNCKHEYI